MCRFETEMLSCVQSDELFLGVAWDTFDFKQKKRGSPPASASKTVTADHGDNTTSGPHDACQWTNSL